MPYIDSLIIAEAFKLNEEKNRADNIIAGVYIFHLYMSYWLVGEKYRDLLRKSANILREKVENGKKEEIFTVPREKTSFLDMGGGAKISYFGQIFTPASSQNNQGVC